MNKSQALQHYCKDNETRRFFASSLDKQEQANTRNQQTCTGFFSPEETQDFHALLQQLGQNHQYLATGGYPQAQRQAFLFLPPWQDPEDWEPSLSPLLVIQGDIKGNHSLSHRDVLGSLMGLGISRRKIADLNIHPNFCQVITHEETAPLLLAQWQSVGKHPLSLSQLPISHWQSPPEQWKDIHSTVATLRLDALLATAFSLPRSKANQAIQSGQVAINHKESKKPDKLLQEGDILSCRGMGKALLLEVKGSSKKGRTIVHIQKFIS